MGFVIIENRRCSDGICLDAYAMTEEKYHMIKSELDAFIERNSNDRQVFSLNNIDSAEDISVEVRGAMRKHTRLRYCVRKIVGLVAEKNLLEDEIKVLETLDSVINVDKV